jgi:hypothetical protein
MREVRQASSPGRPAQQTILLEHIRWGRVGKRSKLTVADILAIRADKRKARCIACDYGLSRGHISRIKIGERWGHVNETNMQTPNGAARRHGAGLA